MYLDTQESKQKLPPPLERVSQLPETNGERLPSMESLKKEIDTALNGSERPQSLVIAGEGEPTLRWNDLLSLANTYAHLNVRVTTNGLAESSKVAQLKDGGVKAVSVALMTADSNQYEAFMQPFLADSSLCPHAVVCEFIREAVHCELDVEVTGVNRPDVDKQAAETLATELGVTNTVRWRPYFP
jgi:molybdenum cofactor biosynthesis enzyme MoaA